MRGRSNIPPRQKPVINGVTKNFVVASGNTISKGDFVSYETNDGATFFQNSIGSVDDVVPYNDKKDLFLLQENVSGVYYLHLVSTSVGVEYLSVVTADARMYFCVKDDLIYVAENNTVSVYKIVSNEFVFVSSVQTDRFICGLCRVNLNGDVAVFVKDETDGFNQYFGLQVLALENDVLSISDEYKTTTVLPFTNNATIGSVDFWYISDGTFCCCFNYYSGSAGNRRYVCSCSFENDTFSLNFDLNFTNPTVSGRIYCRNDLLYAVGSSSNSLYFYTKQGESFSLLSGGRVGTSIYALTDELFVAFSTVDSSNLDRIILYKWDKENLQINNGEFVYFPSISGFLRTSCRIKFAILQSNTNFYCVFYHTNSGSSLYKKSGAYYLPVLYDRKTLEIIFGEVTNRVSFWDGNFTVGYAETSGTAGQTIQVRVPQISS